MFTSKQRSNLRSIASNIEPITQLGKSGVNDSFIEGLDSAIEKRELIKFTVLENSGLIPKEVAFEVATSLNAEVVCVTGRKVVLYRKSKNPKVVHIEF